MATKAEIIEKLASLGIKASDKLSIAKLEQAFDLASQGASISDLNEAFEGGFEKVPAGEPSMAASAPTPPPTPSPTTQQPTPAPTPVDAGTQGSPQNAAGLFITTEDLQKILDTVSRNTASAFAEVLEKRDRTHGEALNGLAVAIRGKEKKPLYPSSKEIPKEFLAEKPLTIFHSGDHHTMDGFLIGDRYVECPRSQLILFTATPAYNIQRFGEAKHIQYICKYETRDLREIDLFKNDIRWGYEYWDGGGQSMQDYSTELSVRTMNKMQALLGIGFEALRERAREADVPVSNIRTMAALIAIKEAKAEQDAYEAMLRGRREQVEKENMLNAPDVMSNIIAGRESITGKQPHNFGEHRL